MSSKWTESMSTLLRLRESRSMTFLERENSEITYDETEMLTWVKVFYERLYTHKDCEDIDLMALLPDIPTLPCVDSDLTEGKITRHKLQVPGLSYN